MPNDYLQRITEAQHIELRKYIEKTIHDLFGREPTDRAVSLGIELYARGVDDAGKDLLSVCDTLLAKRHAKKK